MTDKHLLTQMLGIQELWAIKAVRLDVPGRRLEMEVECLQAHWADEEGRRLPIHGYEMMSWRHLQAGRQHLLATDPLDYRIPNSASRCQTTVRKPEQAKLDGKTQLVVISPSLPDQRQIGFITSVVSGQLILRLRNCEKRGTFGVREKRGAWHGPA